MPKSLQILLLLLLSSPVIVSAEKNVMYIYTTENCTAFVIDSTDQNQCIETVQGGQTYSHRFSDESSTEEYSSSRVNYEGIIKVVLLIVAGLFVYFIPSLVSLSKEKGNSGAIIALNLLLGWTLVGWVVALVWALANSDEKSNQKSIQSRSQTAFADLEKLAELRDKGILTTEEFEAKKKMILSE